MNVCNIIYLTLHMFIMACCLDTGTNEKMKRINHDTLYIVFCVDYFLN